MINLDFRCAGIHEIWCNKVWITLYGDPVILHGRLCTCRERNREEKDVVPE